MPEPPFERVELRKQRLATRLLKRPDEENALLAVQNLLAEAHSVRHVGETDLELALRTHSVTSLARLDEGFQGLYSVYLRHCLKDHLVSDEEVSDLQHLKQLLGLTDAAVSRIQDEESSRIYRESVEEAIRDGRLAEAEREFLEKLQANLRMPSDLSQRVYKEALEARVQRELDAAIADQRLSPEEDAEIAAIAESLGATLQFDQKTQEALDRFRLYWAIENADVPNVDVGIKLQRSERCYFEAEASWYEYRKATTSYRYAGPTARIKIAKGIYWRMGQIGVQPVSRDVLTVIDSGNLYLTNKRLIFMGQKKNTTIRLQRILGYTPFSNGVQIQKDAGKSPFLEFSRDLDLFVLCLERAIRDSG